MSTLEGSSSARRARAAFEASSFGRKDCTRERTENLLVHATTESGLKKTYAQLEAELRK